MASVVNTAVQAKKVDTASSKVEESAPIEGVYDPDALREITEVKSPTEENPHCVKFSGKTEFNAPLLSCTSAGVGMFSKFGQMKYDEVTVVDSATITYTVARHGEDTRVNGKIVHKSIPATIELAGVFDGHGNNRDYSFQCTSEYIKFITKQFETIVTCALTDHATLRELLVAISKNVEKAMQTHRYLRGGCTVAMNLIVMSGMRRVVINFSMGDSPSYMQCDDFRQRIGADHSVDNIQAFQEYVTKCKRIRVIPSKVIYCRFNYGSSNVLRDHTGGFMPIPVYKVSDGVVSVNTETYDYINRIYKDNAGGHQSLRRYVMTMPDGTVKPIPDTGYQNWGNTLAGINQFFKSHGDPESVRYTHTQTHLDESDVNIYEVSPEAHVIIMSVTDGISDVMWTHELFDPLTSEMNAKECCEVAMKKLVEKVSNTGGYYRFEKYGVVTRADWDDISMSVIVSPAISPGKDTGMTGAAAASSAEPASMVVDE